ncbi:hypothetical protein [Pararhizobium sp.]|uniref:hypothetical protein n=1 Tax=Pararhizobium sp. TaxID=1977563 RepID=UPI00271AF970|nr:hypothetical protein [Pararhizobium sp.]MDO9416224.1 hypothetical protein [Pararhizobium sp.]
MNALIKFVDPLHQLVAEFIEAEKNATDVEGGLEDTPQEAVFLRAAERIETTTIAATTYPGAMAALKLARSEHHKSIDSMVGPLAQGALAYFDAIDGRNGSALADAVSMAAQLDIANVKGSGWAGIYDALSTVITTIDAITNQPRCGNDRKLNPAGEYLESITQFLMFERRRVMEVLMAKEPEPDDDIDALGRLKLTWHLYDDAPFDFIAQTSLNMLAAKRERLRAAK